MSSAEFRRDVFQLSRDWLSVQEVVEAVGSASCGAISVFIGSYWICRSAFVRQPMWKRLLQLYVVSRRYNSWGWAWRQEGDRPGVRSLRAHGPVRVHQAVCWHQRALASRGAHLCASPTGVWRSLLLLTGTSGPGPESRPAGAFLPSLFCPDVLPPIKCINWFYRWVEVGQASVVMAISSPHRHDSQQAIQRCINQLKAKIPIWKKVRPLKCEEEEASATKHHHFSINRKFMTRRTAAGRRTLNVHGQLTANSPWKRPPQRTCERAGKDS